MAKKTQTRKQTTRRKAASKASSGRSAKKGAGPKKSSKKAASKTASKAARKTTRKKAAGKTTSKKQTAKKATKTAKAPKKTAKKASAAKKSSAKKAAGGAKKAASKAPAAAKKAIKKAPAKDAGKSAGPSAGGEASGGKAGRKGITIVSKKPTKRPTAPKGMPSVPAPTGSILGMGLGSGKPLIPSAEGGPLVNANASGAEAGKKPKSPFTKKQLDKYREVLLAKRADLLGDIDSMENEALKSQSGSLSNLPQHMAEQGSDMYDQSLSLDLAAADRVLLKEIDAALQRIAERTYGVCEMTGKAISKERLAELPWARYSIEAAREMERRGR